MPSLRSSTGHQEVVANDLPVFAGEVPVDTTGRIYAPDISSDASARRVPARRSGRLFWRETARAPLPTPARSGRPQPVP